MASTHISNHFSRPIPCTPVLSRQLNCTGVSLSPHNNSKAKWVVRLSLVGPQNTQQKKPTVDVERLVGFLYEDLTHVFDEQGIDRTAYDEGFKFRDPITKYDSLSGYLFNIELLKMIFGPDFQLHWVKQTGPFEITTRWTVVMTHVLLPWKPGLVLTGTSIMDINPETGKFCSLLDYWDSITNNNYFSSEGLMDVIKQLWIYKTPELESPKYQILKRTANYEVRKYSPFVVVETDGDKLSRATGFHAVAGLPDPNKEKIKLRKLEGGIAAVSKFSGKPTEDVVREKEKSLRSSLIKDGLRPETGSLLARYNDPGQTLSFIMRNEVLIWLQEFALE